MNADLRMSLDHHFKSATNFQHGNIAGMPHVGQMYNHVNWIANSSLYNIVVSLPGRHVPSLSMLLVLLTSSCI